MVKNLPANAGNMGSTPGLGGFPEEEMAAHSSIPDWKILWTEEPGRLLSIGSQRVGHDRAFMHIPAQQLFYVYTSLHVPIVNS